jgi:PIN domain nuclease of toxin-antitoxin system
VPDDFDAPLPDDILSSFEVVRVLVDTHIWLWLLQSPDRLSPAARSAVEQADDVVLSVASVWELAIKERLGKIALKLSVGAARDEFVPQAGARKRPRAHRSKPSQSDS